MGFTITWSNSDVDEVDHVETESVGAANEVFDALLSRNWDRVVLWRNGRVMREREGK